MFCFAGITQDIYDRKEKELRQKQRDLGLQLEHLVNADESYHVTAKTVLSLAQQAEQIFDSSEVAEKRQLLEMVLQNPVVKGKNLEFTIRKPFDLMAEVKGYPIMLEWRCAFRTFDWSSLYPNPEYHLEQIGKLIALAH